MKARERKNERKEKKELNRDNNLKLNQLPLNNCDTAYKEN